MGVGARSSSIPSWALARRRNRFCYRCLFVFLLAKLILREAGDLKKLELKKDAVDSWKEVEKKEQDPNRP